MRGDAAHHVGHVLRAQLGQVYELSDGERVRLGRVAAVGRDRVEFELMEEASAYEPRVVITLLLSVVKFDAFEWALEKATELGVARVAPLAAARSEKALAQAAGKRAARWKKILLEAAQQSRRVRVPQLMDLQKPEAAFRSAGEELKLMLSERAEAPGIRSVLEGEKNETQVAPANLGRQAKDPSTHSGGPAQTEREASAAARRRISSVALAIGPEGGWADEELAAAGRAGFQAVSLGRLILRAETAVAAGLAVVNYEVEEQ